MEHAPDRPLRIPAPSEDYFGRWWRTALQIPLHPRDMQLRRNVPYGPLARHRLDVWRLSTTPKDAPVIYYIHGGAWTFGDKREQGRPMLHEFVRRGWIVVAINYRLAPRHPWPAQIEDATRALGWIKKNVATYGGDPDRVVVAGGSAGGHLASLLALSADDPRWRPSDMSDVRGLVGARRALLLRRARDDRRRDAVARPGKGLLRLLERRVVQVPFAGMRTSTDHSRRTIASERTSPPFFVVQGANDTLVEVNVARCFRREVSLRRFRSSVLRGVALHPARLRPHGQSPHVGDDRAAVAFAESVATPRPKLSRALVASYQVPPTRLSVRVGKRHVARRARRHGRHRSLLRRDL